MTPEREREIADQVREIITERLDVSLAKVTDEARVVDDLKADSLDTIELTMEIEECFGIAIADAEAQTLRTVGDIIACVIRKLKEEEGTGGEDAPADTPA